MVKQDIYSKELIGEADRKRINETIQQAEAHTSGEVYVVLARESDDYFYPAALVVSFITLVLAILVALWLHYSWRDIALHYFALGMAGFYGVALLYLRIMPALRLWLTPKKVKYGRAHINAMRQFLAHNVHKTRQHTGVLLFVSLAERYAEVIADSGISEKVEQQSWQEIVNLLVDHARNGALADGYVKAIAGTGKILAAHFPAGDDDLNELPDYLVEL